MSNGFEVLIYLSFLLKEAVFYLLLQLQTNIWMLCIFIEIKSWGSHILFYNSKDRHLEFLNLSPQGLISSECIMFGTFELRRYRCGSTYYYSNLKMRCNFQSLLNKSLVFYNYWLAFYWYIYSIERRLLSPR